MIYEEMYLYTNGSYFYRPLLTIYRRNGQTRFQWGQFIKGIQEDLESYGRGYDKIESRDAVGKL